MNKKRLHHRLRFLQHVHPWYFLVIAAVSGVICVFALRSNNEHMVALRDKVYAADEQGGDVQGTLQDLQSYVVKHMNTDLSPGNDSVYPPIQLVHTYDRLVKARSDQLASGNSQLYTEAQHYCEQQNSRDFSGHNRVPCIEQYVQSHGQGKIPEIPDALYKFDFVSPSWSPDLAGWSLLVTVICALIGLFGTAFQLLYRRFIA